MTNWKDNSIMFWHDGLNFVQISDHNRGELQVTYERFENKQRMVDATLRRYVTAKKRTFSLTWDNLPARTTFGGLNTVDGGLDGESLEAFYYDHDDEFEVKILNGAGEDEIVNVMFTEFDKSIVKRGVKNDLWNVSATLEEV